VSEKRRNQDHLTTEDVRSYLREDVDEKKLLAMDSHLAECSDCMTWVRREFLLRKDFDELWRTWTAREHAEEIKRARLEEATARTGIAGETGRQLSALLEDLSGNVAAILRILLDSSRKSAEVLPSHLPDILSHISTPLAFAPVTSPVQILGAEEADSVIVEAEGPPRLRVTVDPLARRISIQGEIMDEPWPLAVLLPADTGRAMVEALRNPEGTDYLLAEFEEVGDGEYFLILHLPSRTGS
jgi:hypothetical protein